MKTDSSFISKLSTTGVYTLILFVQKEVTLTIGKLGKQTFPCGYYMYTGSALGKGATNLKHRIARHLRKKKRLFWHIDFLLANQNVSVEAVVVAETSRRMECTVNSYLKSMSGARIPVDGFGASDCKQNCKSHLLFFPEINNTDCVVQNLVKKLESSGGVVSVVVLD